MTSARWELKLDRGKVEAALEGKADAAAFAMAQHILQVSNAHVPHEEGILEDSGDVSDPDGGSCTVFYDTPYAVRQHEELDWNHDPGRTAKYLENALNSEQDALLKIAQRELRLP